MDLQDELEEQGVEPDEIKARVDELRKKLNNKEFDENDAKSPTTITTAAAACHQEKTNNRKMLKKTITRMECLSIKGDMPIKRKAQTTIED